LRHPPACGKVGGVIPRWFFWTLGALVAWGLWAIMGRLVGDSLSAVHTQALSTLGLLPIIAGLWFKRKPSRPPTYLRGVSYAVGAGVLGSLGNMAYYHALNIGGKASTVIPLTALYPLVTVVLALVFLREHLNRVQISGVALSLLAIYLFNVQREAGLFSGWILFALIPIALWGVAGLLQKLATNHVSGEDSTFWFLLTFVPIAVLLLVTQRLPAHVPPKIWGLAFLMGLFLGLGNYALLLAFANEGKASIITPLSGLYPIVSVPAAIWLLGERIGSRETAAIVVSLFSVILLSYEKPLRSTPSS
jgi:transporter family protein